MREIVIPGEELAHGKGTKAGFGSLKRGDKIVATIQGLADKDQTFVKVVPLQGRYIPHEGDHVIGIVDAVRGKGCFVDINCAYNGYLRFFGDRVHQRGEILIMEVMNVNEIKKTDLDFAKPLYDGKLINVSPVKIPRIVGRKASMADILSQGSNCRLFIGRNGRIYIKGAPDDIYRAEQAIRLIEREAHTSGLTDKIKKFLESGKNGK